MSKQIHGGDVYRHPGVMDFSSNINPLGTPESVKKAVCDSMEQVSCYPDVFYSALKTSLANYEGIAERQLICGNGAAELIFSFVMALRPRKALLPIPTFAEYGQALEAVGCEIVYYPMKEFRIGEEILEQLTPELDMLFLCNPNNPTGFLIENRILKMIMDRCKSMQIHLLLDECFLDFVEGGNDFSKKNLADAYQNIFILKAFTKRYAMAGLRLGYGICGNEELLERMSHMVQPWNVSIPAQAAGLAALKEKDYVKKAQTLVHEERRYLKESLKNLGFKVYDSQANYIFFQGAQDLYEKCLEKNIMIRDCSNYPGLEKGFYRVAVRTHDANCMLIQVLESIVRS